MKYLLIALCLMATGCSDSTYTYSATIEGTKVTCSSAVRNKCGVTMYNCVDGAKYHCVSGVKEVSK